ncbi:WD40-repeat-containing domain protein [Catenaria anguillulae PL171]|uniref:WD40-repeat-containing domain protein n=1 Tax=Catenaria anguillulae PL171 TaxID=765915 RepID=A0A1Y2HIS2_9FUNG|nr:WD40-repeat-containing domain protein [Catenaria anguillulae PL171]
MHLDVGCVTAVEAHPMGCDALVAVGTRDSQVVWMDVARDEIVGKVALTKLVDARSATGLESSASGRGHVCTAKWSPADPALCAVGTHKGDVVILDTRAPTASPSVGAMVVPGAHTSEACGLAWHASGKYLASGSFDQTVSLWDLRFLRTGMRGAPGREPLAEPQDQLTLNAATTKALAWCPWDSNVLAIGGGATGMCVSVWDALGSKQVQHRIATQAQVTHLHWSEIHCELVATLGICEDWQHQPGFAVFASAQDGYADVGKVNHLGEPFDTKPEKPRNRARPVHVCYSPCGKVTFTVDTYGRVAYYRLFDDGWDAGYDLLLNNTLEQVPWRGETKEDMILPRQREIHAPIGIPCKVWPWDEETSELFVPVWPDVDVPFAIAHNTEELWEDGGEESVAGDQEGG